MANSSHDPYWLASVRRETIDHQRRQRDRTECSHVICPYQLRAKARTACASIAHVKPTGFDTLRPPTAYLLRVPSDLADSFGKPTALTATFVIALRRRSSHPGIRPYE